MQYIEWAAFLENKLDELAERIQVYEEEAAANQTEDNKVIRHMFMLYNKWVDMLFTRTTTTRARILTFNTHFEAWLLYNNTHGTKRMKIYLHLARLHVQDMMFVCYDIFGMGYGYFSMQGSKHADKILTNMIMHRSNFSALKLKHVHRDMRLRIHHDKKMCSKVEMPRVLAIRAYAAQ